MVSDSEEQSKRKESDLLEEWDARQQIKTRQM